MSETTGRWKRDGEYLYRLIDGGKIVATIERHPSYGNGHFSLWTIHDRPGHYPTLRDAKAIVMRDLTLPPLP